MQSVDPGGVPQQQQACQMLPPAGRSRRTTPAAPGLLTSAAAPTARWSRHASITNLEAPGRACSQYALRRRGTRSAVHRWTSAGQAAPPLTGDNSPASITGTPSSRARERHSPSHASPALNTDQPPSRHCRHRQGCGGPGRNRTWPIHRIASMPHPIGARASRSSPSGISASAASPAGITQNAHSGTATRFARMK